ncbi:wax ester/triacylglycerol synthase family O-acyltransferase [Nocardia sp. NPDC050793]|uniref:wax ester/triacylglycerol synthase family O-acyltransferase n=1 Tax=Nocardia sp. NPDC050793 TaxID=3155159 RepID=UPI0033CA8E96
MHSSAPDVGTPPDIGLRITTPGESLYAAPDTAMPAQTSTITIPTAPTPSRPLQLSSLDLQLLDIETDSAPMHVGAVTVLDSAAASNGPLDVTSLRRLFADRLHLIAPLRRRVRRVPFGLDLPYWEDCDHIDLGYHVRHIRLPEGAGDEQLADYVARRHAAPLDSTRPLWECDLISGLSDGRQAVYTKIHHAVIDGVSGAEIMAAILDFQPEHQPAPPPADGISRNRRPSTAEILARSLPNMLGRQAIRARSLLQAGPALLRTRNDLRAKHPDVPIEKPTTTARSLAYTSLPLDEVKSIKDRVDGTVNDVVMELCTSALRRWLLDHDHSADQPLIAAIPVSVRTPEQFGTAGNQFSLMLTALPIAESDPEHRLKLLHNNLLEAKQRFQTQPPTLLHKATSLLTPLLHGRPTRALLRAAAPNLPLVDLVVSNVPGPQVPLYLNGIRVRHSYPVSLLTELSGGLNITVMSYDGHLDFGILASPDAFPDVWDLTGNLRQALTDLQQLP